MSQPILEREPLLHIRRNHALEHATLQLLGNKNPLLKLIGSSDIQGFWVIGEVDTQTLQEAADEALARLKAGERELAIHPNCGTNFAISGLLAGCAAWLAMLGSGGARRKLERLPWVISLVTMVLVLTQPLGPLFQARVTTEARPGDLSIISITCMERNGLFMHRVVTRSQVIPGTP